MVLPDAVAAQESEHEEEKGQQIRDDLEVIQAKDNNQKSDKEDSDSEQQSSESDS